MPPTYSSKLRWAVLLLAPLLVFALVAHVNRNRPQTVLTALLAALRAKDEVSLHQIMTDEAFRELHVCWASLSNKDRAADWADSWQKWANHVAADTTARGSFAPDATGWTWFLASLSQDELRPPFALHMAMRGQTLMVDRVDPY